MSEDYMRKRLMQKIYGKQPEPKKVYKIPNKSAKKIEQEKAEREIGTDSAMNHFFEKMRPKMTGICQCGCGRKSSKNESDHYRSSICHIFPKRIFKSIATNEYNWVERNFWEGCHGNTDNRSMDLWVNFADFDDIKEKFYILAELLTDEERKTKFYNHLSSIIYKK